jgi:hypothetical protein
MKCGTLTGFVRDFLPLTPTPAGEQFQFRATHTALVTTGIFAFTAADRKTNNR